MCVYMCLHMCEVPKMPYILFLKGLEFTEFRGLDGS